MSDRKITVRCPRSQRSPNSRPAATSHQPTSGDRPRGRRHGSPRRRAPPEQRDQFEGAAMTADAVVEDEVRELVRRRGLDPIADPSAVRRLVEEVISEYDERSIGGTLPQLVDA